MFAKSEFSKIEKFLIAKDGNIHTLMVNIRLKGRTQKLYVDDGFNSKINDVLDGMQKNGYEIINITNSSYITTFGNVYYQTLVMYK